MSGGKQVYHIYKYSVYTYIPATQMTLVFDGKKCLVLEGSTINIRGQTGSRFLLAANPTPNWVPPSQGEG